MTIEEFDAWWRAQGTTLSMAKVYDFFASKTVIDLPTDEDTAIQLAVIFQRVNGETWTPVAKQFKDWLRSHIKAVSVESVKRQAIEELADKTEIRSMGPTEKGYELKLRPATEIIQAMGAQLTACLKEQAAENYVEMALQDPKTLERFTVTVQRTRGLTAAQKLQAERDLADKLAKQLQAGLDCNASDFDTKAILAEYAAARGKV